MFKHCITAAGLVKTNGEFLAVNDAYCDLLGFSSAELVGRTFQSVTAHGDSGPDSEMAEKVASGQISSYEMEKRYLTKRNHVVWVLLRVDAVKDSAGNFLCFLAQARKLAPHRDEPVHLDEIVPQDTTPAVPKEVAMIAWAKANWPLLLWILSGIAALVGTILKAAFGKE